MVILPFGIPGTSAAELPPHALFNMHGRRERVQGGVAGIPLMSMRGVCVCVCVQGRREALYMTRRFHGNVVRPSKGVYFMELWGVM